MVQRRPITSHPSFAPLIGAWFAALLGLTMAVLPDALLARALSALGLGGPLPLTLAIRVAVAIVAAVFGALVGYALARRIAPRMAGDPRPIYAEGEAEFEAPVQAPRRRRPLHIREELDGGFGDESQVIPAPPRILEPQPRTPEEFMILTPQPIHPPQPEPGLDALLDQFDTVFAAFSASGGARTGSASPPPGADPVQTFVARQTGVPAPTAVPPASRMGGLVPDHQAELRAALDKLARSQGKV